MDNILAMLLLKALLLVDTMSAVASSKSVKLPSLMESEITFIHDGSLEYATDRLFTAHFLALHYLIINTGIAMSLCALQ